jgi:hypothetical protein
MLFDCLQLVTLSVVGATFVLNAKIFKMVNLVMNFIQSKQEKQSILIIILFKNYSYLSRMILIIEENYMMRFLVERLKYMLRSILRPYVDLTEIDVSFPYWLYTFSRLIICSFTFSDRQFEIENQFNIYFLTVNFKWNQNDRFCLEQIESLTNQIRLFH